MTFPVELAGAVAAGLLALASGANDGATILALALAVRRPGPLVALALLLAAIGLVPMAIGIPVASTLLTGLVRFDTATRPASVTAAVVVAIVVAAGSSQRGLPTSLTLALIGALVGIGLGSGQHVAWPVVAGAIGIAAAAPVVAGLLGLVAGRAVDRAARAGRPPAFLRRLHVVSYVVQSVAYGANDGQKILAALLATGIVLGHGATFYGALAGVLVAFGVGALLGLRRVAGRVGRGVVATRPIDALLAQGAASTAVIVSAALGAPVSMTQSTAAALVGGGLARGSSAVRWAAAGRILGAWALTLPLATAIGLVVAAVARLEPIR